MQTLSSNFRSNNGQEILEAGLRSLGGLFAEYRFHKRAWRFDYYLSESHIAIEIEGAVFAGGRHSRGIGFVKDTDKYNTATCMGIAVYRITTNDVKDIDRLQEHLNAIRRLHIRRARVLLDTVLAEIDIYAMRRPKKKVTKLRVK